ncbi:MAG TPA: D-aminoacylase [Thermodesulfovibrionia bacterium]|nr:D-aminoacylase [Thermodesulfovibrionia bacterium]
MKLDYLIKGGTIIDGTGSPDGVQKKDIGILGDRIAVTGQQLDLEASEVIDANGLCVSPGFIDAHTHSEFTLMADGRAQGKIAQGVTTEVNGNCGLSAAPLYGEAWQKRQHEMKEAGIEEGWQTFEEYFHCLQQRGIALNFATLVGHGNLRGSCVGYANRRPKDTEIQMMGKLLKEALDAGAFGMSTGLPYPPGVYADTEEIEAVIKQAFPFPGLYATHMRSEGDELLESIDEAITIATTCHMRLHISHLKTSGPQNWRKIDDVTDKLMQLNAQGYTTVTCDRYPYVASSTDLDIVLPPWVFDGGDEAAIERLVGQRAVIRQEILQSHSEEQYWEKVLVSSVYSDKNKWMQGMSLADLAYELTTEPVDILIDLLVEERLRVGAVFFTMNEDNLRRILKLPFTVIGSDSSARSFDGVTTRGLPHPRGFGSFPRVLGRYVREEAVLSLHEAIHKMTGLTAGIFAIAERGFIKQGYYGDLTMFDKETIIDRAAFTNPFVPPEGIHYVFVNGEPVFYNGTFQDRRPGRILKKFRS